MRRCGLLCALLFVAASVAATAPARAGGVSAGAFYLLVTDRTDAMVYAHDARIVRVPGNGDRVTTSLVLRTRRASSTYDWHLGGVSRDGGTFALSREVTAAASDTTADVVYTDAGGFVTLAECVGNDRNNPVTHALVGITYTTKTLGCPYDQPSVSPSGDRVALFLTRPKLGRWFAIVDARGHVKVLERSACAAPSHPAWSPDGSQLAYICGDPTKANTSIRLMNAAGQHDAPLAGSALLHPDFNLSWSGDGKSLLFVGEPFRHTDRFDTEAVERGYMRPDQMLLSTEALPMSIDVCGSNGDLFGPTCCTAYAAAGFETEGLLGQDDKGVWHAFATPRDAGPGILVWPSAGRVAGRMERIGANDVPFWAEN